MKSRRMFFCAMLFMGLTVAKFFLPEQAAALRLHAKRLMTRDADAVAAVEAMGRELAESGFSRELIAVVRLGSILPEKREGAEEERLQNVVAEKTEPVVETMGNASAEEEENVPEVVSAFLASQAEFEGYALPENVRADMPDISFAYASPVAGYNSSGFGFRLHPIDGIVKFHYGTDFAANEGDDVTAFADGKVYAAGTSAGYGNYLILTHEGGYATLYAHMSKFLVSEGEKVSLGQSIGRVGHTGNATGPHLHFELLLNDIYINPEYYL